MINKGKNKPKSVWSLLSLQFSTAILFIKLAICQSTSPRNDIYVNNIPELGPKEILVAKGTAMKSNFDSSRKLFLFIPCCWSMYKWR